MILTAFIRQKMSQNISTALINESGSLGDIGANVPCFLKRRREMRGQVIAMSSFRDRVEDGRARGRDG